MATGYCTVPETSAESANLEASCHSPQVLPCYRQRHCSVGCCGLCSLRELWTRPLRSGRAGIECALRQLSATAHSELLASDDILQTRISETSTEIAVSRSYCKKKIRHTEHLACSSHEVIFTRDCIDDGHLPIGANNTPYGFVHEEKDLFASTEAQDM